MGLQDTPKGERFHIVLFGRRNAGKSSLLNAIVSQPLAIVSDVPGTTTDPVQKAMELLPLGPCLFTDTPGLDDEGELGQKRVEKALEELHRADAVILAVDIRLLASAPSGASGRDGGGKTETFPVPEGKRGLFKEESRLAEELEKRGIPYLLVLNQADTLLRAEADKIKSRLVSKNRGIPVLLTSAVTGEGIEKVKEQLGMWALETEHKPPLAGDLIAPGETAALVVPIDAAAPKGRLILPQQQVIRDILDHHGTAVISQPQELPVLLGQMRDQIKLVITDSQVFKEVVDVVPDDIFLTSFSILFARYKGNLSFFLEGVKAVKELKDGDKILMAEGCTHHRQCEDIGTVKIPALLKKRTGKQLQIETCSGKEFPKHLSDYSLIIHCGGCTLQEKEMKYRMEQAEKAGVPMVNYGIFLAAAGGILDRSIAGLGHRENHVKNKESTGKTDEII